jgi:hypothetical protein
MEKRCIGKNSIESVVRESQIEEILMPDLAVCKVFSHFHKRKAFVDADWTMPKLTQCKEVSPWAATQIENIVRTSAVDIPEQCFNVLANVMVPRALQELVS